MKTYQLLDFLSDLKANNNREWFQGQKARYEVFKKNIHELTGLLIAGIQEFDPGIGGLEPRDCIFRINRDIRFSSDKSPYKTHSGLFIVRGGKQSPYAGYYLHLEPGASFAGGGIYAPAPDVLKSLRQEIFHNYEAFSAILQNASFRRYFDGLSDMGKTIRPPKGFPPDFAGIDILKHKHIVTGHTLPDKDLTINELAVYATEVFRAMHPLCVFLNTAVEDSLHPS